MTYQEDLWIKLDSQANTIIAGLPDFAKKYFNHIKDQGLSPRTKLQYAYDMKRFFDYLADSAGFQHANLKTMTASDVLDKLSIEDIQEYVHTLDYYEVTDKDGNKKQKLASASIKARRISSLRSFYKYYFKIGEIHSNLSDLMDIPKIAEKNLVVMNRDHVSRLLAAVTDTDGLSEGEIKRRSKIIKRDFAIVMLLLGTGIRISELVGINLNDVDFYEDAILVTRKDGNEDEIYFGAEVETALLDYIDHDRDTLLSGADEEALFISMHHKRLSQRSVETMMKNYALKAGLNMKVTPHTCRRTFGTNLYEETGDIYLVADALHHSSVETTRKHYAKMSKDHKRIAAEKSSTLFKE